MRPLWMKVPNVVSLIHVVGLRQIVCGHVPSISNTLSITHQAGSGISQQNEQQQLAEIKYDMVVTFAYYWEFHKCFI